MRTAALVFALAVALPLVADDLINADRPGIADSSTTVGRGTFQAELGVERDDMPDRSRVTTTPLLLRYGLSKNLELRVETDGRESATIDGAHEGGYAPVAAGVKWHFADAPSLGIIGSIAPKSGSGVFRSERIADELRLAADINLGEKWSLNPNVGVSHEETTGATAALTVQYNLSDRFNVFVDGGYEHPQERGGTYSLNLDAGTAYIVGRNTQLDFSLGWGGHGADVPRVWWAAGISRRF